MQQEQEQKIFVTIREAASMMSVSRDTIYRLINRGELPSVKVGSIRRIRVADIHAFGQQQDARELASPRLVKRRAG